MGYKTPLAIVTGASRGAGLLICERLLQASIRVLLFDTLKEEGKRAEGILGYKYGVEKVAFLKGDVSHKQSLTDAFEKAKADFGRIDLLINNAGVSTEIDPKRTVAVNLLGPIYGSELALKYMGTSNGGKGGVVINVTSISGLLPYPDTPTYVAIRHGLIGLTRSYGHNVHFEKNKVRFMVMCPHTDTPMTLTEDETSNIHFPENVETILTPAKRVAEGIMMILRDKRNGSTLFVSPDSMEYLEIPEYLRKIPTVSI